MLVQGPYALELRGKHNLLVSTNAVLAGVASTTHGGTMHATDDHCSRSCHMGVMPKKDGVQLVQ
jgi:hypothetical protein